MAVVGSRWVAVSDTTGAAAPSYHAPPRNTSFWPAKHGIQIPVGTSGDFDNACFGLTSKSLGLSAGTSAQKSGLANLRCPEDNRANKNCAKTVSGRDVGTVRCPVSSSGSNFADRKQSSDCKLNGRKESGEQDVVISKRPGSSNVNRSESSNASHSSGSQDKTKLSCRPNYYSVVDAFPEVELFLKYRHVYTGNQCSNPVVFHRFYDRQRCMSATGTRPNSPFPEYPDRRIASSARTYRDQTRCSSDDRNKLVNSDSRPGFSGRKNAEGESLVVKVPGMTRSECEELDQPKTIASNRFKSFVGNQMMKQNVINRMFAGRSKDPGSCRVMFASGDATTDEPVDGQKQPEIDTETETVLDEAGKKVESILSNSCLPFVSDEARKAAETILLEMERSTINGDLLADGEGDSTVQDEDSTKRTLRTPKSSPRSITISNNGYRAMSAGGALARFKHRLFRTSRPTYNKASSFYRSPASAATARKQQQQQQPPKGEHQLAPTVSRINPATLKANYDTRALAENTRLRSTSAGFSNPNTRRKKDNQSTLAPEMIHIGKPDDPIKDGIPDVGRRSSAGSLSGELRSFRITPFNYDDRYLFDRDEDAIEDENEYEQAMRKCTAWLEKHS